MSDKTITDGVVVALAYELQVDGEKVDEAAASEPFEYLHGAMNIVPGLEAALAGRKVGDRIQVTVPPEQGYGVYNPDEVEWFTKDEFEDVDDLEPGMVLTVEDDDELYDVTVLELTQDEIALDFNPPLAGKTLQFDVQVVALRPAEPDEVEHGHPHSADWDDEDDEDDEDDWDDEDEDDIGPAQLN
jgi:FKBP-type peptidyl-prolyl cis-trans isomerase SlyD